MTFGDGLYRTVRVSVRDSPVVISRSVRVSVMVNPGDPALALHGWPAGMLTVLGLVGLVRGP